MWKDLPDGAPKGAGSGTDAQQRAAALALDRIRAKSDRLARRQDMVARMASAQKMAAWSASLCASIPSAKTVASVVPTAGAGLRHQWGQAALPTRRVVSADVRACDIALRRPMQPRVPPADTVSNAIGSSADQPAPLPAAFLPMTDAEYDAAAEVYKRKFLAGDDVLKPPLNPEQRLAAGDFLQAVQMWAHGRRLGWLPKDIDSAIRAANLIPVTLLVGPGGAGKSLSCTRSRHTWRRLV